MHRIFVNQLAQIDIKDGSKYGMTADSREVVEDGGKVESRCELCNLKCNQGCKIKKGCQAGGVRDLLDMIEFTVTKVAPIKKTVDLIL